MRKYLSALICCVMLFITASPVFACYEDIYVVGAENSTVEKDIFVWDETPWLYLKLDRNSYDVDSTWISPSASETFLHTEGPEGAYERWITPADWSDIKETGSWKVDVRLFNPENYPNCSFGHSCDTFTVTPEPLGCFLFLLGSAALGWRRRRMKT